MTKRILIADDSVAARMIIKQYLQIVGLHEAEFVEVNHGGQALEQLKESSFDLIVTDMNMPVMDGRTFIRRLKASPRLNQIPVIIISSAANKDNQEAFMKYGANYVISKPISPNVLNEAIQAISKQEES
ncbi:Response regulator [Sulfidibacter corallicola]|uniref:Response regulator n=1 Tax=Sulfidibacter corallicola TaxID=2818388 RepID=A0A8A4U203_SULCO|nr:response regulator [Sulfidibacter corallicola]QTD52765.1 response regulator [Sulfidibacter corallicola]